MESAIRELTKTVCVLQNEITSLKSIVQDQNNLIKKLVSDKNVKISEVEQDSCEPQQTERPIRSARLRAISALSRPSRKHKEVNNTTQPASSTRANEMENERASVEYNRQLSNDSALSNTSAAAPRFESLAVAATHAHDVNNSAPDEWTEVKSRKSRREPPKNVTRGTAAPGSNACSLVAAERKSYLHLYYVQCGTTKEQVMAHLNSICASDSCAVDVLKSRGDYASFKLTVPTKNMDRYMSPEYWAENVCIKPWRNGFRKTQQTEI